MISVENVLSASRQEALGEIARLRKDPPKIWSPDLFMRELRVPWYLHRGKIDMAHALGAISDQQHGALTREWADLYPY